MKVLIVDDHALFRHGLIRLLKGEEDIKIVENSQLKHLLNLFFEDKDFVKVMKKLIVGKNFLL